MTSSNNFDEKDQRSEDRRQSEVSRRYDVLRESGLDRRVEERRSSICSAGQSVDEIPDWSPPR